jgi:hypothetical protein
VTVPPTQPDRVDTSDLFLKMLRREATVEEYVEAVKRKVREQRKETLRTRRKRRA